MLWQYTVHRTLWHRITKATVKCKPLISTKNRKARLEFAKKHKGEPVEFWNRVLWTDETNSNLYLSDGKAKVWRKRELQMILSIQPHLWRWCHGMGMSLEQALSTLLMTWCLMTVAEWIWNGTNPSLLPIFKKMPPDISESTSYCIRTMTQNALPVQSRSLSGQRNGTF